MKLSELAELYDRIGTASGAAARRELLAGLLERLDETTLGIIAHLTVGEVVPPDLADRLQIGPGTIRDALARALDVSSERIEEAIRETGDISEAAARLPHVRDELTVENLWRRFSRTVERDEGRPDLLACIFSHTSANGSRYAIRMILREMRLGIGTDTLLDAVAHAFNCDISSLRRLYAMTNDIGLTAVRASRGSASIRHTGLALFRPYQFMNATRADDADEVFGTIRERPLLFEVKYDGARLQIHIASGDQPEIRIYSRRLSEVTGSLPDVVRSLREAWYGGAAIVEGEAVAFDPSLKEKQPFQAVLMRLGRKYDIEEKADEYPFVLYLFEVVYHDGHDLMERPQRERREILRSLFRSTKRIRLTEECVTDRADDEESFFRRAIEAGQEGLMAKAPDAPYVSGRRLDHWMKLKPEFETLDVVVVGGIWGTGRRKGTLSSLRVAVRDGDDLREVGKVGTGFTEGDLRELTEALDPLVVEARGRESQVEPSVVIEVDFQGIQKTRAYDSGYALRIPRFKRRRPDKGVRDADTLERLKELYGKSTPEKKGA